jgi:hypothetical protein
MDAGLFRGIVLLHTLALGAAGAWLIAFLWRARAPAGPGIPRPAVLGLVLASMALIAAFHVLQARRFAEMGYRTSLPLLALVLATAVGLLLLLWRRWPVLAVVASALALKLYPLAVFPVTARRSDMLPLVEAALRSFRAGQSMYRPHLLDNGLLTTNVRFPGLVAAYLPAFLLGLDLRLVLLLAEAAFFAIAWTRWRDRPLFLPGCALLAFLPYWHVRHELYEAPFWVVLLLAVLAVDEDWPATVQAVLLGLLLCFHQWGLLLGPFLLVYAARKRSPARAAAVGAAGGVLALGVVGLASRGDLSGFVAATFGTYPRMLEDFVAGRSFPPGSMSLTPFLADAFGARGVRLLNAGLQAALFGVAVATLDSRARLFAVLAASLLLMNLTNVVTWTYQYLLVAALLWLGLTALPDPARP